MGNRMHFPLEYNKYIDNIGYNTYLEDSNLYKLFIENTKNGSVVMKEGLITTYPVNKSISVINNRFQEIEAVNEVDDDIYIEGDFDNLRYYIPLFNNLVYYISTVTIDDKSWITEFDNSTKPTALYLNAKYDIKIDEKYIPKLLYHVSTPKLCKKILDKGLVYSNKIYLTKTILTAKLSVINISEEYFKEGFIIYKINTKNIHDLYIDINLYDVSYYTTNNIHAEDITIVLEKK